MYSSKIDQALDTQILKQSPKYQILTLACTNEMHKYAFFPAQTVSTELNL